MLDAYTGLKNKLAGGFALFLGALPFIDEQIARLDLPPLAAIAVTAVGLLLALLTGNLRDADGDGDVDGDDLRAMRRGAGFLLLAGLVGLGCRGGTQTVTSSPASGFVDADASGGYQFADGEGSGDLDGTIEASVGSTVGAFDDAIQVPWAITFRATASARGEGAGVEACFVSPLLSVLGLPGELCAALGADE